LRRSAHGNTLVAGLGATPQGRRCGPPGIGAGAPGPAARRDDAVNAVNGEETAMGGLCEGRVAIVTGAGRGLGRQHALLLAAHRAKVVVNDIGAGLDGSGSDASPANDTVAAIRRAGGEAIANGEDVSDWNAAKAMIDATVAHFGRLDVLINNAGILRDRMLTNMEEQEWDAVIRVHLKGTFAPSRHAAAYWRDASKQSGNAVKARIINTTSTSGIYGNVGQTNYGAAKAAIAAFTIIAARELRRYGVTVNAISPSAQTRMTEGLRVLTPEARALRDPKWVSPIVVYLASEQAQDISGRVIQAGFGRLGVCEGWRRGAEEAQVEDPERAGTLVRQMIANVRKNSGMDGMELD
jgi:NAD(P)-dependent dehydrogenase (short-subunit alcohol dehydrogenase family)